MEHPIEGERTAVTGKRNITCRHCYFTTTLLFYNDIAILSECIRLTYKIKIDFRTWSSSCFMRKMMPWKLFLVQMAYFWTEFIRLFNLILLQNHGQSSYFLIATTAIVTFCDNVARLIRDGERCVRWDRCSKLKSWTFWSEECRLSLCLWHTSEWWIFISTRFWQWTFYKEWKLTHDHNRFRRLVLRYGKTRLCLRNRGGFFCFLYLLILCIQIYNIHNKTEK